MTVFTYENNSDIRDFASKHGLTESDLKDYFFNCEYYETRNSWGHRGFITKLNRDIDIHSRIRYYNRTWEEYTYQSLLFELLRKLLKQINKERKQYGKDTLS